MGRLLADQQEVLAVWQPLQDRRGTDIEVGTVLYGAVRPATDEAGQIPGIPGEGLVVPQEFAVIEIDGQHGVAGTSGRRGVGLASADIKPTALQVDSGAVPHRGAGGGNHRRSRLVALAGGLGRFGNGVGNP